MKKTLVALAAVMMMGGAFACAQQPEKSGSTDKTAVEQPATQPAAGKPADGTCPADCGKKGEPTESNQDSTAKPAEDNGNTAANAE